MTTNITPGQASPQLEDRLENDLPEPEAVARTPRTSFAIVSEIQHIISKHVLPASGLPEQPPLGAIEEAASEIAGLFERERAEPVAWIETAELAKLSVDAKPKNPWLFLRADAASGTPRTALYASRPAEAAGYWRPIETAPKDGTEIILFGRYLESNEGLSTSRVTSGFWCEPEPPVTGDCGGECRCPEYGEPEEPFWCCMHGGHPAGWMSTDGGFTKEEPPILWMPLPASPGSTEPRPAEAAGDASYQERVKPWLDACFGPQIAIDKTERNHRFIEEALELVQSTGCTRSEAHQLVDYVYGREAGDPDQEVGGVMNTLAALCLAHGLNMHDAGERELARVNQPAILEKIRAKQKAKPKHSPLPVAPTEAAGDADTQADLVAPEGWFLLRAEHLHTPIINRGDAHDPLPHPEGPWLVEFQRYPSGGMATYARGLTLYEAWVNASDAATSRAALTGEAAR